MVSIAYYCDITCSTSHRTFLAFAVSPATACNVDSCPATLTNAWTHFYTTKPSGVCKPSGVILSLQHGSLHQVQPQVLILFQRFQRPAAIFCQYGSVAALSEPCSSFESLACNYSWSSHKSSFCCSAFRDLQQSRAILAFACNVSAQLPAWFANCLLPN